MKAFLLQPAIFVTFITALLTALLALTKLAVGYWGQSHALLADGVHSLADLLVDAMVLLAAHYGNKQADENHPYGHGRIETAGTFGLATILILAGIGIIWDAGNSLWGAQSPVRPDKYVLWVAVLAIIVNELLFRYTLRIAKRINSSLLAANAWHSRSDAAVSIVVLLSIAGALLGFSHLDAIGAVIVGIMIGKMGGGLAWQSICELVDTGVNAGMLEKIRSIITQVPGVCTLHHLRTRTSKNTILVDVHILVPPYISVSEGHFIGDQVIVALRNNFPEISDITVHVDPEDDEIEHPSSRLPDRETLTTALLAHWQNLPGAAQIKDIRLHYLAGKIELEVILTLSLIIELKFVPDDLHMQYKQAISDLPFINQLKLLFSQY